MGEPDPSHHFHDFGILGRAHDSQNRYYLFVDTKIPQSINQKNGFLFILIGSLNSLEIDQVEIVGKDWRRNILKIRLFLNMEYISSRKHEMEIW